jgi:hypothetical protein
MRKSEGLTFAAALVAAGIFVWTSTNLLASSDRVAEPASKPAISGYDIHLRTNVKDLPVQVDEDAF